MLTGDQIEDWEPRQTQEEMLNEQVDALRYYLAIENQKIIDAEIQKAKLMKKISQCRRKLLELDRTK